MLKPTRDLLMPKSSLGNTEKRSSKGKFERIINKHTGTVTLSTAQAVGQPLGSICELTAMTTRTPVLNPTPLREAAPLLAVAVDNIDAGPNGHKPIMNRATDSRPIPPPQTFSSSSS